MSHHYSGPNLGFPGGDARLDHRSRRFPQAGRSQQVDPYYERAPVRRLEAAGTYDCRALRARGALRAQDRRGRRCRRRYRTLGALRVFRRHTRGASNNFQFAGEDFFAEKDICSIVLEVSNSVPGSKEVGLWARTLIPAGGVGGSWVQADRGARPSQTPFLAGEQNDAYRAGEPADDARFGGSLVWVFPNPSGRNRAFSLDQLVNAYRQLYRAANYP